MVGAYKGMAYAIVTFVALQAAWVALAVFGLGVYIEDGNAIDKAAFESGDSLFPEEIGFMLHGMLGTMLIPLLALLLLVFSFFTKLPGAKGAAGIVLGLVVLQVLLGMFAHAVPWLGLLHGINAFLVAGAAFRAASLARTSTPSSTATPSATAAV